MKKSILHSLWGFLFILCACLGFIQERTPVVQGLLTAASILFFLPPAALLWQAGRQKDEQELLLLCLLSLMSLCLTAVFLTLTIASAPRGVAAGLDAMLAVVSVPMYCGDVWAFSMLLWACLGLTALELRKRCKR